MALNQECEKSVVTLVLGIDVRLRGKEAKSWLCTWLGRILPRRGDRGCVQHQKAETVWVDDGVWGLGEPE